MSITTRDIKNAQVSTAMVEAGVIGSVLIDNTVMDELDLDSSQFYSGNARIMFDAMQSLHKERKPIDLITLSEFLRATRSVDLFDDIAQLARETPSARNAKTYAAKVKDYWKTRETARIAYDLQGIQKDFKPELIDRAIRELMALNTTAKNYNHHISSCINSALNDIEEAAKNGGKIAGVSSGIPEVDRYIGGFHNTDLIIVAARPAMGKTALLLNMLTKDSLSRPGIASAEQGHNQIGSRLLSIHGNVNGARMRAGELTDGEFGHLGNAMGQLKSRCIWVTDKPGMSIADIERQARQWKIENQINILGVDYIQKIKHDDPRLSKIDQIGDITVRLKDIAKELNIPVVALAQVNRKVEDRPDKLPQPSDIKDSGMIEQEADQIITIMRPEVYEEDTPRKGVADLNICKNRHGPIGITTVKWVAKYMQFNSMTGNVNNG